MKTKSRMTTPSFNYRWKIVVFFAVAVSFYSIYENGQRVQRLERQVCDTVVQQIKRIDGLDYYKTHPKEKIDALQDNVEVLERFHCPQPTPTEVT
jgi:hypothetical protein